MTTAPILQPDGRTLLRTTAFVVAVGLAAAGAGAQTLSDCVRIADDTERLACYDRVSGAVRARPTPAPPRAQPARPAPDAPAARAGTPVPAPALPPPAKPASLSPQPTSPSPAYPDAASPPPTPDDFGFERRQNEDVDEIRSRYIGQFTGWSGRTLFRLENGQVWKQSDSGRFVYRAENPEIVIRRAAFGSFRLSVDGLNRSVRVKRIK